MVGTHGVFDLEDGYYQDISLVYQSEPPSLCDS